MTVNIKIGDTSLDNHIYWLDRPDYSRDYINITYTPFGIPIIEQVRRLSEIGGNIITLESKENSGWQLISTAKALKNDSNRIELGSVFTFQYYTQSWECMFYSEGNDLPAVTWRPVVDTATTDTDWCLLTIRLIITQLKIGEGQIL
jgi:hypothetical protein